MITIIIIAALAASLAMVIYRKSTEAKTRNQKKIMESKLEYLEKKIEEVQQDVDYKRDALMKHQAKIQQLHDDQLASIRQAKRIQTATFTQDSELTKVFPEAFIFTKTHSIVSGDFYKAAPMEHYNIFALADCAGCGVPGGFLSMLGISLLNEQISIHYHDQKINLALMLETLRDNVIQALSAGASSNVNDGMNMTLVAFAKEGGRVLFAGADQNLYICHEGKVRVINGDKYPVGWYIKGNLPFSQKEETVSPGDMVYLTTDSLQSQFGGPQGAKFTHKRLIQMFEDISTMDIKDQKQTIHNTVYSWVEGHKQIDDLTLAGVRVI
ncbi:MAG: SpoIIE family protein phosphatase [Bacteroidales bacterium]|nr:SpoIIE family protein phosphatase [Bacteroidales bacterium]